MEEVWKDIEGYEGVYQVSNFGRVRSVVYITRCSEVERIKIRKQRVHNGYSRVNLNKKGSYKTYAVHRLVAKAFIQKPRDKEFVNHIDGNKLNNNVENLEWCTSSENAIHAWNTGLQNRNHKKNNAKSIGVVQFSADMKKIRAFPSMSEVQRQLGIRSSIISRAAKTGRMANGYIWKYAE